MSDWIVRAAMREDESCIIDMWMHQLLRFSFADPTIERPKKGSDAHVAFWRLAQPVIEGLLRSPRVTTTVVCDPTRATPEPGCPAVICGWVIRDDRRIYGVGLKRQYLPNTRESLATNAALRDIGEELARTTLGALIEQVRECVLPPYDLYRLNLPTPLWAVNGAWLGLMADVARLDAVSADVVRHIYDPTRVPWVPNEQRAA